MRFIGSLAVLIVMLLFTEASFAEGQAGWVNVVSPAEGLTVIGKRPRVEVEILQPVAPGSLMMMMDGTDITQVADKTEKGLVYTPISILSPGQHSLTITALDMEGRPLQKVVTFTTRHTEMLEQASSTNDVSALYETVLVKPDGGTGPDWKVEGSIKSDTKIGGQGWDAGFLTNIRYFDANIPVTPPMVRGFNPASWLLSGTFKRYGFDIKAGLGDVVVNESPYTATGLARRGGLLTIGYDRFQLDLFSLRGSRVVGFEGGTGIGFETDDHISGASAAVNLLDKKILLKAIYINGGESGISPGISAIPGGNTGTPGSISGTPASKKGDVVGFLMTTNLLQNRLTSEAELDFSRFDPDTTQDLGRKDDLAWRVKFAGIWGKYNYDAMYEYIGRDYGVVGNQMMQKDKQGFKLNGGANFGYHIFSASYSQYNDNVRSDYLLPRTVNYQGNFNYTFTKLTYLPMGLSYQISDQETDILPKNSIPLDMQTNTVSGWINYVKGSFNAGFRPSYVYINSGSGNTNDSQSIMYALTASYTMPHFSISPAFTHNMTEDINKGLWTDTYTITLDTRTRFLSDKLFFDLGGSYLILHAHDGSVDNKNLTLNGRLGYSFKGLLKGYLNTDIAVRATYVNTRSGAGSGANTDDFSMFLVLAANMPISF